MPHSLGSFRYQGGYESEWWGSEETTHDHPSCTTTWVSLYTRMLACDDTDYPHLHPRGPPRNTRVVFHGKPGARSWKRLLHMATVSCRGIEFIAITHTAQHAGYVLGGFESAIIECSEPRLQLSDPPAAISISQFPIEAGSCQDIHRRASTHCGVRHGRPRDVQYAPRRAGTGIHKSDVRA